VVKLSHIYPRSRYLRSSKLLTIGIPETETGESLRDQEVIDWLKQVLETLRQVAGGEASKSD
jgi:hypothetical protein